MATRLKERYGGEVAPALTRQFSYTNHMQVPTLHKIVLNVGLGEAVTNSKALDAAVRDLGIIAGQKPVVTKAKKSIAAFKLREAWTLEQWSPCGASACGSFWTG